MITVQGVNLAAYEEQVGSLNADVRLDGRELTVTEFVVDKPQPDRPGRLTAAATYDLERRNYSFDLQSQGLRLDGLQLPNGQRLRGDVQQLTAKGAGNLNSPEGTVNLTVDSLAIESQQASASAEQNSTRTSELGRVVIMAQAMNNEATINASSERFNLNADALVGLAKPWPATVKMRADKLDLAALPHQVASEKVSSTLAGLEGQLRATIDASGDLAVPEKGRVTVTVESLEGLWNGRPFMVASPSPIHYADERLTVDTLEVGQPAPYGRGRSGRDRCEPARQSDDNCAVPPAGNEHLCRRRHRADGIAARHAETDRSGPDADGRQRARPVADIAAGLLEHQSACAGRKG
jgi:hypothetical protein